MNILIVGSGAREHAIAKALKRSPQNPVLFCYGSSHNPGIMALTQGYVAGDITRIDKVLTQAKAWNIQLAIIGPEAPLEKGLADVLCENHILTIGPKQKLAQLETSKAFTRDLITKYKILGSPLYGVFDDLLKAKRFLQELGENNYVVKANGLMGGKGVKVAGDHLHSLDEAYEFCKEILAHQQMLVIEEKLIGQEFSLLCFSDGKTLVPMPLVQDHKRAFINDEGPNTGGMGSYSAADHSLPFLTENDVREAQHINEAVLDALTQEFREPYIGVLYGSFMATKSGVRLIEYNARFGDPEALNLLTILESDFVAICAAMATGRLSKELVSFAKKATVCKYAVPNGYPDQPLKNVEIEIARVQNPDFLYLGAVDERDGKLYATGSRTAAVVSVADTIFDAEKIAETEIDRIEGPLFHREDIGTENLIKKRIQHMETLRQ